MNSEILISGLLLVCPLLAVLGYAIFAYRPQLAAQWAGSWLGLGFLTAIGLLVCQAGGMSLGRLGWLNLDTLNLVLASLVFLVSFVVHRFSLRYLQGDRLYRGYFIRLTALSLSAVTMTLADNFFLFWGAWSLSNLLLVRLMVHKPQWQAAKNSGVLTLYTLTAGSIALLLALLILSHHFAMGSLAEIGREASRVEGPYASLSMSLVLFAALAQSALYPFHRWLISSLNSPTPVSALMHAGLVNGGGILMVKFAPLMILQPELLMTLFVAGAVSAFLGTLWKLIQSDMKKMLACSTLAQMGFMMMQCGIGLFAAAIAHLCWHGLFKAYLFLSSGSALRYKTAAGSAGQTSAFLLISSLLGGVVAMAAFAFITAQPLAKTSANNFVLFFAFIAGAQLLLSWRRSHRSLAGLISGLVLAGLFGLLYGTSIHLIESILPKLSTIQASGLGWIHWLILGVFAALWLIFNLGLPKALTSSRWGAWLYMKALNGSQPAARTITAFRSDYYY